MFAACTCFTCTVVHFASPSFSHTRPSSVSSPLPSFSLQPFPASCPPPPPGRASVCSSPRGTACCGGPPPATQWSSPSTLLLMILLLLPLLLLTLTRVPGPPAGLSSRWCRLQGPQGGRRRGRERERTPELVLPGRVWRGPAVRRTCRLPIARCEPMGRGAQPMKRGALFVTVCGAAAVASGGPPLGARRVRGASELSRA